MESQFYNCRFSELIQFTDYTCIRGKITNNFLTYNINMLVFKLYGTTTVKKFNIMSYHYIFEAAGMRKKSYYTLLEINS